MKRVAVLGGGPAGAMAAGRLAAGGLPVVLLDEKLAWEKPCGGGLTYKAYQKYPFLIENATPKRLVAETRLAAGGGSAVSMKLKRPVVVYARRDLNAMLLERAARAGAQVEKEHVVALERAAAGWRVRTRSGVLEADAVIVATGARNRLRDVGTELTASDAMCALGYFIPATQEHIDIQFLPDVEGYIWVFPRQDHLSAGIAGKGVSSGKLRALLENYLRERGHSLREATFFGHIIPALEKPAWPRNRLAGDGWMAVGDAGGLVDPVTGEGIYYALRSGDLAAQALLHSAAPHTKPARYRQLLEDEFVPDLVFAAGLAKRFFLQKFMLGPVPAQMIEFMRRSPALSEVVQDLFAGTQNYLTLKQRLMKTLNGTAYDLFVGSLFRRRPAATV